MKNKKWIQNVKGKMVWIRDSIFPFIPNHKDAKKLSQREEKLKEINQFSSKLEEEYSDVVKQINREKLTNLYIKTFDSKEKLENKAKAMTLSITVSVTLVLNLSNIIINIYESIPIVYIRACYAVLGIIAIGEMIMAALLSAQVFLKEITIYVVDETKDNVIFEYKKCIILNRLSNLKRSNYIYTAYENLRNSLVILLFFFVSLIVIA